MNDDSLMPFGKHKDKPLSEVPDSYLIWLMDQLWVKPKYPELWQYLLDNADIIEPDVSE